MCGDFHCLLANSFFPECTGMDDGSDGISSFSHWLCRFTIICTSSRFFGGVGGVGEGGLKLLMDHAGWTKAAWLYHYVRNKIISIFFIPVRLGRRGGQLLHYLALGSLLFMFLWLVRLLRTQLLASDASLELIAPFLCSQLHSSSSSSGCSSSSSSSTSLSSSLRSSRSTYGAKFKRMINLVTPVP